MSARNRRHDEAYREHRVRTSLSGKVAPSTGTDTEFREKARELWRQFGIVVIWPDQTLPWDVRASAESAAIRLYGARVKR